MSFRLLLLFHTVLTCSILSCTTSEQESLGENNVFLTKTEQVLRSLDIYPKDRNSNRLFLIIPIDNGCKTCTYKALDYFKENSSKNNKLYFVFTDVTSSKSVTARFGQEVLKNPQVFLDKYNSFFRNGVELEYPIIIYVEKGKIVNAEICSSNNFMAYFELNTYLSNKQ